MAFEMIDISTLPVPVFGRHSTEPRISISEVGRFQFNKLVQEKWEEVTKCLVQYDPAERKLAFVGLKEAQSIKGVKPESYLRIKAGMKTVKDEKGVETKEADGTISAGGSGILQKLGYDFKAAGNQSFEAEYNDKMKAFIITLPKETPQPKPKVARTKKAETNGAASVAPPVEAPAEEELLEIS